MKNLNLLLAVVIVGAFQTLSAQDFTDTANAQHALSYVVPEIAILDIFDRNGNVEEPAQIILTADDGTGTEAGLYDFTTMNYDSLFINYTSVISDASPLNKIEVEVTGALPKGVDLRITPAVPVIVANGGSATSRGVSTTGGVLFSNANLAPKVLVNNIGSVYTGDKDFGVQLTYALEQTGSFSAYRADTYNADIIYTISSI